MRAKYGLPEQVLFCKRCVMSNQRPNSTREFSHTAESKKETIHFDEEGVCNACRVAERKKETDWQAREEELKRLCDRFRSRSGAYDCIVPGSGGKDSFYAAHYLRFRMGMHPLLVSWSPHIPTEWGLRNLRRWQSIADCIVVQPNIETHRLLTRLAVDNLFHPFAPFIYGQKSLAPKLAALYNIPLVFFGESEAEYGNPRAETSIALRESDYYAPKGELFLGGIATNELANKYGLQECDLAAYMPANPAVMEQKKIEVHYLGFYLKWKPQECFYYSQEHGGFETSPERQPGTWSKYSSLDDKADDFHYRTTYIKFGIGRATYDASQEIRSGDITREEGIALVRRFDHEYPVRFEREFFEYLSVRGFPVMDKARWLELEEQFKSPHLWDGDRLRCVVS